MLAYTGGCKPMSELHITQHEHTQIIIADSTYSFIESTHVNVVVFGYQTNDKNKRKQK
jgi:hypothetical protein